MKKYLMTGIAALTLAGIFTSCSHDMDLYSGGDTTETIKENYEIRKIMRMRSFRPLEHPLLIRHGASVHLLLLAQEV